MVGCSIRLSVVSHQDNSIITMTEQTLAIALIIGVLGASCSLGLAVGARDAGENIRSTQIRINIGDVVKLEVTNDR